MAKTYDMARIYRLAGHALANGAELVSESAVRWDLSDDCLRAYWRTLEGRPGSGGYYGWDPGKQHAIFIDIGTRCRRCQACAEARSRLWRARMKEETNRASRTWMGTLTLRPEEHQAHLNRVRHMASGRGIDFDGLGQGARFRALVESIGRDVTLYLKRVRKNSGARIRYCLVAEPHKSGWPHIHMLLHEVSQPTRKRLLQEAWGAGFSHFKLVESNARAVWYVSKYLSKSIGARVRASVRYGGDTAVDFRGTVSSLIELLTEDEDAPESIPSLNDLNESVGKQRQHSDDKTPLGICHELLEVGCDND